VPVVVDGIVVVEGVAAALCFAASSAFKHASAERVDAHRPETPHGSVGFLGRTLQHPLWLAGLAADAGGVALQIAALRRGALAVVQPLLLSSLVFALLIHGVMRRRLAASELGWAAAIVALLTAFTLLCRSTPDPGHEPIDQLPALVAGLAGVVVVAASVLVGIRRHAAPGRPAVLGFAAGVVYAATAALLKSLTTIAAEHGIAHLLVSWQLYAVVLAGAVGLAIGQLAFRAGPLAAGLPIAATVDPLLSIGIGVLIFDEHLRLGPGNGVVLGLLLTGLSVAVLQLARVESPAVRP
jgi:drug/metabolite transporter (DMT)-like permease